MSSDGFGSARNASRLASPAMLTSIEQRVVVAASDAMFPRGGAIEASGSEAGVLDYFERMLAEMPPKNRALVRLLLVFIELSPLVFFFRLPFSRQGEDDRVATLEALATSPIYFLRITFQSLRTLVSIAYLANDDVARQVGAVPNLSPFEGRS